MGGIVSDIFGGGKQKVVKAPPVSITPPPPTPEVGREAGDIARRKRPRGFEETFLTGELTPDTGKKKRLA